MCIPRHTCWNLGTTRLLDISHALSRDERCLDIYLGPECAPGILLKKQSFSSALRDVSLLLSYVHVAPAHFEAAGTSIRENGSFPARAVVLQVEQTGMTAYDRDTVYSARRLERGLQAVLRTLERR